MSSQQARVQVLNWPPYSPDLSPIESKYSKAQDFWAVGILHETRMWQHPSPKTLATGLLTSQILTDSYQKMRGCYTMVNTGLFQLFWDMLLRSKSKCAHIFHEIATCLSFNIWYVLYVILGIKYGFDKWFAKHCILFLSYVLHSFPTFLEQGLYTHTHTHTHTRAQSIYSVLEANTQFLTTFIC